MTLKRTYTKSKVSIVKVSVSNEKTKATLIVKKNSVRGCGGGPDEKKVRQKRTLDSIHRKVSVFVEKT